MSAPITLGIATAGPVGAALVAGEAEHSASTASQALDGLLRCVKTALRAAALEIGAVERIAVCVGPGSFTGLRIGVAFAKSLAQARAIPIVGVSSYDVAEWGATSAGVPTGAVVEGKRSFYYARIRRAGEGPPAYCAGDREAIVREADGASLSWLSELPGDEQALRVARIGRDERAAFHDWRHVMIDYGQRPNAVINWEAAHGRGQRGDARSASNKTGA